MQQRRNQMQQRRDRLQQRRDRLQQRRNRLKNTVYLYYKTTFKQIFRLFF